MVRSRGRAPPSAVQLLVSVQPSLGLISIPRCCSQCDDFLARTSFILGPITRDAEHAVCFLCLQTFVVHVGGTRAETESDFGSCSFGSGDESKVVALLSSPSHRRSRWSMNCSQSEEAEGQGSGLAPNEVELEPTLSSIPLPAPGPRPGLPGGLGTGSYITITRNVNVVLQVREGEGIHPRKSVVCPRFVTSWRQS